MHSKSKLKWNKARLLGYIGFAYLITLIVEDQFFGSHVSFDHSGNFAVQISKSDYRQYKEQITFDQLCAALVDLFKRFLQYYRQGKESRILVELGD